MWDLLFTIVLFAGVQIASAIWTGSKKPPVLSVGFAVAAALAVAMTVHFVAPDQMWLWTSIAAGHIVYILIELICRRGVDALSSVSLCLVVDMLLIPFLLCGEDAKSYSFYGLVILLSLICAGLYRRDGSATSWLSAVKDNSTAGYVALVCVPLVGVIAQTVVLLVFRPQGGTLIGVYVPLLLIAAAAVLLQKLCAEHYALTKAYREMQAWQQGARDYMNTIRSQRHDFNIHMHAIDGMIGNGEYAQCRRYVGKMVEDASDINDIMPVYDAMIGSMLYNMRRNTRLLGSDIFYDIKYDMKHVVCNAFECNKIIGNLIQNAIDALDCEEAKRQGIQVGIFRRAGNAVITVSNYFHGDEQTILRAFDLNWSGKSGHEGIGLSMIERTLKKYGGKILAEWKDQNVTFIVHIPVKYLPEEES